MCKWIGWCSMHTANDLPESAIHPRLRDVFRKLDQSGEEWLLLRGEDDLLRPVGDVDILVSPVLATQLDSLLRPFGFVRVVAQGRGSHKFFFSYSREDDCWFKLDVVSDLRFGRYAQLQTSMSSYSLRSRVRHGLFWLPSPADKAWLQLLHLILDKGEIVPSRVPEAVSAGGLATLEADIAVMIDDHFGSGSAAEMLDLVRGGRFDESGLLSERLCSRGLARDQVRSMYRALTNRALRKLPPAVGGRLGRGLVLGVMGPDGAGKTSLLKELIVGFPIPATYVYMGMWSTSRWDPWFERIPGGRLAKKIFRILRAAAVARYSRLIGNVVLMDRVPHDARLPGSLDRSFGGRLSAALAFALGTDPDLLLTLDAPGAVMFGRKGEHSIDQLERWRQAYLEISKQIPVARVLDATQSMDALRRQATELAWQAMSKGTQKIEAAQQKGCDRG